LETQQSRLRLAILQRVCPGYRVALFSSVCAESSLETKLFIGEDIPNSKVKSAEKLTGINFDRLPTRLLKIGHRTFTWHVGLIKELKAFKPEVILCEGESHFVGYVQAILYKLFFSKKVTLIHWCFISLPGESPNKYGAANLIKAFFRKFFDAHLLYSTYSKEAILKLGVLEGKVFVATNVGDVDKFLRIDKTISGSPSECRLALGLPEKFTVLYTGTLDENKRPEVMLELAKLCDPEKFNFVLLGSGVLLEKLRTSAANEKLLNVYLPGRVDATLYEYYKAASILIIPGRGGIVISEAMAFGLPVIVHHADGTEFDLVRSGETGFRLEQGDISDFKKAIETLQGDPELWLKMGKRSKELVQETFTTRNMVNQIVKAAHFTKSSR
jgi:glycosyltransferase involved in cell wall biosynthesis